MATSGSWRIFGSVAGLASGTRSVDVSIAATTTAVDQTVTTTFTAATFQAIFIPTGSTAMLIVPPATNAGTITLKGVTGDTGIPIHPTKPTCIALATSAVNIGLLCSATTIVTVIFM